MLESRKKNSTRNLILALVKYVISIVTAFTLRTLMIMTFGDVFSGLISLYSNIISILSVTELGIGSLIIYKMYKPIAEGDDIKVRTLLMAYKKIYYVIAGIILTMGLLMLPFLKALTGNVQLEEGSIYYIFIFYLFNCIITYAIGHRRALLFTMQRNWVENLAMAISILFVFPIQIIILTVVKDIYLYLLCDTLIKLLECFIIVLGSNRAYKRVMKAPKVGLSKEDKKELIKNTYALSYNKISSTVFNGMDNIIISACLGVTSVFLYSNYFLVLTYLFAIINIIVGAIRASVGNYVNTMSMDNIKSLFKQLNLASFMLTSFCGVSLFCLIQPFMVWWGVLAEHDMLLVISVPVIMAIYFYVDTNRHVIRVFKETNGLFWKDRFVPLIASSVNVVLSIALALVWGIEGVILSTLISVLLPTIIETQITFKDLFKESSKKHWLGYLLKFGLFVLEMIVCFILCELVPLDGIIGLIIRLIICGVVTTAVNILVFFKTETFKGLISKVDLKKFFKRKQLKPAIIVEGVENETEVGNAEETDIVSGVTEDEANIVDGEEVTTEENKEDIIKKDSE